MRPPHYLDTFCSNLSGDRIVKVLLYIQKKGVFNVSIMKAWVDLILDDTA